MAKQQFLAACAFSVLAIANASPAAAQVGGNAGAQDVPTQAAGVQPVDQTATEDAPVRDVVVTGSLIQGTPEDAALPVDVIGSAELARQGSPTPTELLKNLPTSSAVLGDSNQFDSRSQGAEGIASANLRGLSPQRTLVLLNSRRLATSGNGVPVVDLNLLPQAAIGRVEVLKDGAAATYGSDAVAGVINFITRTDQEGFQVAGNYRFVRSTDGDFDVSASFGHRGDNWRFLVAAGYQKRAELLVRERDYGVQSYAANPQGGWTGGGNPGNFLALTTPIPGVIPTGIVTGIIPDTSCVSSGGFIGTPKINGVNGYIGSSYASGQCLTQYSPYDALVDEEKRGQAYLDFDVEFAPRQHFELTALYGRSEVPHYRTSPSYILTQTPSVVGYGGTNPTPFVGGFYVPASNPGLIAYRAANPTQIPAIATGVVFPTLLYRPFLSGGNPATLNDPDDPGAATGSRFSDSTRVTGEFRGDLTDSLNYNVSATYHNYFRHTDGYDSFGDRVQRALQGFGGPNCTGTTPGANGCLYLNPFGNQATRNAATGQTIPQGSPALANSAELANWFFVRSTTDVTTELFVGEASISGKTGLTLPGGDVSFAVGGQYRYTWLNTRYGPNSNIITEPCRESPINGNINPAACAPTTQGGAPVAANGAYAFLGTGRNSSLRGGIKAVFAELQLPILDSLNVQLGARYEDYGGQTGSTFNPQARARFQATPWLAFRGGIGTTFRGPTLANLVNDRVTSLQLVGSAFKPVDVFGNPALTPEKSTNYSGGLILSGGGFSGTIDYYKYKLRQAIINDPLSAMLLTLYPTVSTNNCATLPAAYLARFTFSGTGCTGGAANVARVTTFLQNGARQTNEGIDIVANYRQNHLFDRDIRLGIGGSATRVLKNAISDITVAGVVVQRAYNGVGLLNYQASLYPIPKWKGQAFVDLGFGPIDMRLQGNYTGGLHDQRFDSRTGPFEPNYNLGGITVTRGADISKFVTADYNVQLQLPANIVLTGTVTNIFDRDPPFAREDYNYEPFIGNPLGRTYKIGASFKF